MKQANFSAKGKFDLLVEPLTFDVDLQLKKLDLVKLNPFFKEYGPLDLTSGQLNFFMEMTSKAGKLKGYLKPMFKNMDVRAGEKERDDSFKEFGFEIITAVVGVILKNSDTKSLASKIPVSGNLNDPKFDMWEGIKVAVSNGFGKPDVKAKVDKEINVNTIKKSTKKVKEDKK